MAIGAFQIASSRLSLPFAAEFCSYRPGNGTKHKLSFSSLEREVCAVPIIRLRPHNSKLAERRIITLLSPRTIVKSTSGHCLESDDSKWSSVQNGLNVFYRFMRPRALIGIVLGIVSISLLAIEKLSDFSPLFFMTVLKAVFAAVLMNTYVVGLNQLTDIEIDKVNKPHLPLASGEYSVTTGVTIISSCAALSFWLGWVAGSWPLFWVLFTLFILGTAYSVDGPFLRWKRFPVLAAMCIFVERALVLHIPFYLHAQMYVYGRSATLSKPVIFATAFMSIFSIALALFKDIPDKIGDEMYGIQSLAVRWGQERVFWICIWLIEMAYVVALFVGITSSCLWSKWITVIGHSLLGLLLWDRAKSIDFKSKDSITSFYSFIWKLCYVEYLLIPLVR